MRLDTDLIACRAARRIARPATGSPVIFGIHPGGAIGTIGPAGRPKPEDAGKRLAALRELRGNRAFVVHLYDSYTTRADGSALPSGLAKQIDDYTADGFQVELVLAYRPTAASGDVDGFVDSVRQRVRQLGANPGVTALQVTNEANVSGSASATDGFYPRGTGCTYPSHDRGTRRSRPTRPSLARSRLQLGLRDRTRRRGVLEVRGRARRGTAGRRRRLGRTRCLPGDVGTAHRRRSRNRRQRLDARGHEDVASHVHAARRHRGFRTDTRLRRRLSHGTGTDRRRSSDRDALSGPHRARREQDVQHQRLRWFDLRDSDSSAQSFEAQYGIMRDDYAPKPAFRTYRELIAGS